MSDTTVRPTEIDKLFGELCELAPAKRAEFLERRVKQTKARDKLRRLLAVFDNVTEGASSVGGRRPDTVAPTSIGPYSILRVVGSGGMGVVYLARRDGSEEIVALKVLRSLDSDHLRKRFLREAQVLRRLDHPGICRFLEVGDGGTREVPEPFLAMEYVHGRPLAEHAHREQLDDRQRLELTARVCDAVEHAHAAGVVHRDLKPSNVLVVRDDDGGDAIGRPVVLDFGIARATGDDLLTMTRTHSSALIGTVRYMSPEQVGGRLGDVAAPSDVYSLGVLLFEMLAGRPPYDISGRALPDAVRVICEEEPTSLGSIRDELRGDVETIVAKCLEKAPQRRFASAGELAADLRRHLANQPISTRPPTLWYRLVKFSRRHKLVVAVMVALGVGLVIAVIFGARESAARRLADQRTAQARDATYRASLTAALAAVRSGELKAARRSLELAPPSLRKWEFAHLQSQIDQSVAVLRAPLEQTSHKPIVRFDPTGEILCLWEYRRSAEGWSLVVHRWSVEDRRPLPAVSFATRPWLDRSDDGEHVYGVDSSGRLDVWSAADGALLATTQAPNGKVQWMSGSAPASRVVVGMDGSTFLWDFASSRAPTLLGRDEASEWAVDAGAALGAGVSVSEICVRDLDTGGVWRVPCEPPGRGSVAVDPSGRFLAEVAARGSWVGLWAVRPDGPPTRNGWITLPSNVRVAAFSPDGERLAVGGDDGIVRVWLRATERLVGEHSGAGQPIADLAFAPDGATVASVETDYTVRLWGGAEELGVTHHEPLPGFRSDSYVYSVVLGKSGHRFYTASWGLGVRIFDAATALPVGRLRATQGERMVGIDVNPDETMVAVSQLDGPGLRVLDLRTGAVVAELDSARGMMSFSPDGERLAAVVGGHLKIWDTAGWELLEDRDGFGGGRINARYDPRGRFLAVAKGREVVLFEAQGMREVATLRGHVEDVHCLAFSPSGDRLATRAAEGELRVWDLQDLKAPRLELAGEDHVNELVWGSPDRLFLAGMEGALIIYDVEGGTELLRLSGHSNYIYSIAADPARARVITGSGDTTARLWETTPARTRFDTRRSYAAIAERLAPRVADLVERLGPVEAIRVFATEPGHDDRAREIAAQRCIARALGSQ